MFTHCQLLGYEDLIKTAHLQVFIEKSFTFRCGAEISEVKKIFFINKYCKTHARYHSMFVSAAVNGASHLRFHGTDEVKQLKHRGMFHLFIVTFQGGTELGKVNL